MPPNLQEVKLKFARRRTAKVMGSLAAVDQEPQEGDEVQGIMVTSNFQSKIVAPEDLEKYTPLRLGSISSKLHVPFIGATQTLELFLNELYSGIAKEESGGVTSFSLHGGQVSSCLVFEPDSIYQAADRLCFSARV